MNFNLSKTACLYFPCKKQPCCRKNGLRLQNSYSRFKQFFRKAFDYVNKSFIQNKIYLYLFHYKMYKAQYQKKYNFLINKDNFEQNMFKRNKKNKMETLIHN